MSWTDLKSIKEFNKFKSFYNIKTFVETGTFRGVNAEIHAHNFEKVITCELKEEYYNIACKRLSKYNNVYCFLENSPDFLQKVKKSVHKDEIMFIYLDAHFYDESLPPKDRWVVLKELKALENFPNCVIAIHDFDNGELGHLNYDGQDLNFELLKDSLYKINSNFSYYTNTFSETDIVTEQTFIENYPYVEMDEYIKDNLNYVWSSEEKTFRGILYCTPSQLNTYHFKLRNIE